MGKNPLDLPHNALLQSAHTLPQFAHFHCKRGDSPINPIHTRCHRFYLAIQAPYGGDQCSEADIDGVQFGR